MVEKLTQTLKNFDYRLNRYQIHYSVAMWHCPEEIDISILSKCIRTTDRLICLNEYNYAIVFDYTNPESGLHAANNLLKHFKSTYSSVPLFCSIVNSSQYESVSSMIPELFTQLNKSIENNQMAISS
ncbi:MAG: hypothetical protein JZU62_05900 [Sulfuricurvum sp.]|uniref:hypothetical protein n=1 Tax=Sulfuricurvum sp. TaxID=2025608 RepID=UPI0025D51E45|nr:hypothetical protein [Sulfuricurvum sp.]MBV5321198.1 hypothetical protein [Sulfuricurvum sp.]